MTRVEPGAPPTDTLLPEPAGATRPPPYARQRGLFDVTSDIAGLQTVISNVYFVGDPADGARDWVLVDAGLPYSAGRIWRHAERRFGAGARPRAIVLTHGHFTHRGGLPELAERWDVPVYAHELELPFLTGVSNYPPADPFVGGGLLALVAGLYPRAPIDLGDRVRSLPRDGSVPHLPGWRAIHTPGHTPGHTSFFRDADRTLLAGVAFVTTKPESLWSLMTNRKCICGPPACLTTDWAAAWASVQRLANLNPAVAATGHGLPMAGHELTRGLRRLAHEFESRALPRRGRYVGRPAVADKTGVLFVPPAPTANRVAPLVAVGLLVAGVATYAVVRNQRRSRRDEEQRRLRRTADTRSMRRQRRSSLVRSGSRGLLEVGRRVAPMLTALALRRSRGGWFA